MIEKDMQEDTDISYDNENERQINDLPSIQPQIHKSQSQPQILSDKRNATPEKNTNHSSINATWSTVDGDETVGTPSAFFDEIPHSIKLCIHNTKHRQILWDQNTLNIISAVLGLPIEIKK
ncbi:MAG: hypothetical protein EZS28_040119 [Streblomastix strix]|uniref:Uncharacterized protein n=1 Tax=Streblomastix strix TaxID=222440 RepID=A0A5J4U1U8_9EUKA|nr:MAG: hypothetical protein EZS28_040119 [Streblomastix strix]